MSLLNNDLKYTLVDGTSKVLSISEQCRILGLPRSEYYRKKRSAIKPSDNKKIEEAKRNEHLKHCDIVLGEWSDHSTYGYIKMSHHMLRKGYGWATEHCIRRIYKELGLRGQTPVFKTTRPSRSNQCKYPYLLRNRTIRYANEVWATDITYIKLGDRMVFFTAIIDLYSRKILTWRLSPTMDVAFCMDVLMDAIVNYGAPAIFNTDQGSQYTSRAFTMILEDQGIQISMDGVGRCKDNIFVERTWRTLKYEWIFLRDYESYEQLENSLADFIDFFNNERIHQSLDYRTPDEVYKEGTFQINNNTTMVA